MKTLKEIKKAIDKAQKAIEAKTALIMELDYITERREARESGGLFNNEKYKELREKAEANKDRIVKLSKEIYTLEIEKRIWKENEKTVLFSEAWPVIKEACRKYNGKPYGEKTAEKIREEVRSHGFGFYFSGSVYTDQIDIYELSPEGYKNPACCEVKGHSVSLDGHRANDNSDFITRDNRINTEGIKAYTHNKYVENPAQQAKKTAKAIKAYQEATKEMEKQRRALVDLMPEGIPEPDYIKEYYVRF